MPMLVFLEMLFWRYAWIVLKRILMRMLAHAKEDIIVELIALLIGFLRSSGMCPEEVKGVVQKAYEEGSPGVERELRALEQRRSNGAPCVEPQGPVSSGGSPGPSPDPSKQPEPPMAPPAAPSTLPAGSGDPPKGVA